MFFLASLKFVTRNCYKMMQGGLISNKKILSNVKVGEMRSLKACYEHEISDYSMFVTSSNLCCGLSVKKHLKPNDSWLSYSVVDTTSSCIPKLIESLF